MKESDKALKQLIYCLDGRRCDLNDRNYGDADEWILHIDEAYDEYINALDEEGNHDSITN